MAKYSLKCWKHVDVLDLTGEMTPGILGGNLTTGDPVDLTVTSGSSRDAPLSQAQICDAPSGIGGAISPGSQIIPIVTLRSRTNAQKSLLIGAIKSDCHDGSDTYVFSAGDIDPAEVFEPATDHSLAGGRNHASFLRGTLIDTPHGAIPIEQLEDGDEAMCRNGDIQMITGLSRRRYSGLELALAPNLIPVRIMAGALTGGRPGQDLLVAQDHRLLVDDWRAAYLFGEEEILVPAKSLLNNRSVILEDHRAGVEYFDIVVADGGLVCANGLWAETHNEFPVLADQPMPHVSADLRVA